MKDIVHSQKLRIFSFYQLFHWFMPLFILLLLGLIVACGDNKPQDNTFTPSIPKLKTETKSVFIHSRLALSTYSLVQRAYKLVLLPNSQAFPCQIVSQSDDNQITDEQDTKYQINLDWSSCYFNKDGNEMRVEGREHLYGSKSTKGINNITYMSRGLEFETDRYSVSADVLINIELNPGSTTKFNFDQSVFYTVEFKNSKSKNPYHFEWTSNSKGTFLHNGQTGTLQINPISTELEFFKKRKLKRIGSQAPEIEILANEKLSLVNLPPGDLTPAVGLSSCGMSQGVFDIQYTTLPVAHGPTNTSPPCTEENKKACKDTTAPKTLSDRLYVSKESLRLETKNITEDPSLCSADELYFFREAILNARRFDLIKLKTN